MAYSYVRYTGNGSTTNYTFSFPTISTDHIKVRVNGTLVTNWSFLSASTIQFAAAPANAAIIEIRRETPKDSSIVNFTDGSVLLERDLDLLATYDLYLAQETEDDLEDTIRVDSQGRFDALNKRIINVADPVAAQDAVTKNWLETTYTSELDAISLAAASSATAAAGSATTATTQANNAAASAVNAANSAAAAATALDNFDDRYLGQKSSDPAVDNDGNALITGSLYYNTTDSAMRVYTGTGWINASSAQVATMKTYVYVATAAQTTFTGNDANGSSLIYVAPYLIVSLNGLELRPVVDYTATSGLSVVLTTAATAGDELQVQAFSAFNVANIQSANVSFQQGGTGSTVRSVDSKLKEVVSVKDFGAVGDGVTDDTAAIQAAAANKILNTTDFNIPIGIYPLAAQVSVTAYNNIYGSGDTSQVKVSTGTAFAFTSQSGVFDDHPHNFAEKMRITGNGIFAAYPNAQTGTTVGYSYSTVGQIGNFASCYGMTYELHDTGRYIKSSYTHNGSYNYYRANKVGLKLEETTSFTESNSYFRYNSTAAIQIIGGQNITIRGGAIEGNSGAGLLYSAGAASWGQLNLQDCYFESNGNEATGVWSIDVPFGSPIMVNITGGSFWRNIASGITSGPYRFGDNVTLDGATINGSLYAKYARVRNTRGNPNWNTSTNETTARLFGLTEPVIMLEYSPVFQEYNFVGATGGLAFSTLLRGRGSAKIPGVTNLINTTYPYSYGASSGATSSANAALNYGEGDFFKVQYGATVGNFSSNYATLHNFTDITKPYRVVSCIAYPEADCEIAIVQSVGGQSLFVNYALKANTYYKLVMCGNTPMTAGSFLRIYPINTAAPAINFLPMWASQHATHKEQLLVLKKLVDGEI